jgi:hypothetical protein
MNFRKLVFFLFCLIQFLPWRFAFSNEKQDSESPFKPFKTVTKDTTLSPGLFNLYRTKDGKLYLEIQPSQLDKPFLFTAYLTHGIGFGELISGMPLENFLFEFHEVDNKVEVVEKNPYFSANPESTAAKAVQEDFTTSILADLPILSVRKENGNLLVDATSLFLSDLANLSDALNDTTGGEYTFSESKSHFVETLGFPLNDEIQTSQSFETHTQPHNMASLEVFPDWRSISLGVHYSLASLPKDDYMPRLADSRIGYFTTSIKDFSSRNLETPVVRYINRWNIKNKPIVFWIENTTPPEYRDAIKAGVLEWNKAFAKIGIPNALEVKVQPEDSSWKPGDMRYNVIYWTYASQTDFAAVGPSLVNPLTGEIYNAAVVIDGEAIRRVKYIFRYEKRLQGSSFGFTSLARKSMCSFQALESKEAESGALFLALNSPNPQAFQVPKTYLDAYIKDVVMHEIGHCLGLRHNFHASTMLPLSEINNKKITEKIGLSASVMDYLPVNIAPKGKPQGDYFDSTIGPYDYWAIAYGYSPIKVDSPEAEKPYLAQIASQSGKHDYAYETDEDTYSPFSLDPLSMIFDLSSDPLDFSAERFQMYRSLLWDIGQKLPFKGREYPQARNAFDLVLSGYALFLNTPLRYVGGEYFSRSHAGDKGTKLPLTPIDKKLQLKALSILDSYLFSKDAFSVSPKTLNKLAPERDWDHFSLFAPLLTPFNYPFLEKVSNMQSQALGALFSPVLLNRLLDEKHQFRNPKEAFTLNDLFSWMTSHFFSEVTKGENIQDARRMLQQKFLRRMISLVIAPKSQFFSDPEGSIPPQEIAVVPSDARSLALYYLHKIQGEIQNDLYKNRRRLNVETVAHLQACLYEIHQGLEAKMEESHEPNPFSSSSLK